MIIRGIKYFFYTVFLISFLAGCNNNTAEYFIIDPDYAACAGREDIECYLGAVVDSVHLSGASSVILTKKSPYGLTVVFPQVKAGEIYEATMYRNQHNPYIKLVADSDWGLYCTSNWHTAERKGWQEIKIWVRVPDSLHSSSLKFYAHNTSQKRGFVDSLVVKRSIPAGYRLLPDYAFYPLLYEVLHDYNIRHYADIDFDSITGYSSKDILKPLFVNRGTTSYSFIKTFESFRQRIGDREIMKMLHKMKDETHLRSVGLKWEKSMDKIYPAGYALNMFCSQKDTAHVVINDKELCKTIKLYKLQTNYETSFVRDYPLPSDSLLKIPCNGLTPGIYRLELIGEHSNFPVPLIVNDTNNLAVTIVAPFSTWHAYNDYGGKSLYRNGIDSSNVNKLSTLRPITSIHFESTFLGHDIFIVNNIYNWFNANYGANIYPDYWLEAHPSALEKSKTIVLAQHCEYFSPAMYRHLIELSETRNLLSLGANQIFWKIKWNEDFTELQCKKDGSFFTDSPTPGGNWRNNLTSEAGLLGVAFTGAGYGTYTPYRVTNATHWLYHGTDMKENDLFGEEGIDGRGLSGDEMDKVLRGSPEKVEVIAKGENPDEGGGEIAFIDRGDYGTFSCGSIACGSGLGKDTVFTALVKNFMEKYHQLH